MALTISMIFLLVMTVIGISAMRMSILQEQMSGNARDHDLAFQAAEAALREAEAFLLLSAALPEFDNTNGLYQLNAAGRPDWTAELPSDGNGFRTYGADLDGTATRPRYFIEELSAVNLAGSETETGTPLGDIAFFRVTAVGYGGAVDAFDEPLASVVLSTVYRSR
jgi:type IV pilus assembly protein PilX